MGCCCVPRLIVVDRLIAQLTHTDLEHFAFGALALLTCLEILGSQIITAATEVCVSRNNAALRCVLGFTTA